MCSDFGFGPFWLSDDLLATASRGKEVHKLTVKCTSRAARIEPAVGTAAVKLAARHDALLPRTMPSGAAVALLANSFTSNVRQQSLSVAASADVEFLLRASLDRVTTRYVVLDLATEGTLHVDAIAVRVNGNVHGAVLPRHMLLGRMRIAQPRDVVLVHVKVFLSGGIYVGVER